MATYYVRSTDGDNADTGATWALAEADLHTPTWAAGDVIYVSQSHAQSSAASITIATNGTLASPTKIICANDAAEPPTAVASTGTVTTTGATNISITGASFYVYGLGFSVGTLGSSGNLTYATDAGYSQFDNCSFTLGGTNTGAAIVFGNASASINNKVLLKNPVIKFNNASQRVSLANTDVLIQGGSAASGGTSPTTAFVANGSASFVSLCVDGFDFSNWASTLDLFTTNSINCRAIFRNCKLPASWTGDLVSAAPATADSRVELYNCDSGDTNYRLWIEDYAGTIKHSTTVYNDAGASDGTTRISWQMVSSANTEYPNITLKSPEIVKWNETTGSAVTATVEIVHESQGSGANGVLNDDEIWLEVQYLGTSGTPISTFIRDSKADVLATAAAQTTSAASWTGDAAGWDTQKLSVTFTPQEKGFIHAVVHVAKASATIYVDPLLTVA